MDERVNGFGDTAQEDADDDMEVVPQGWERRSSIPLLVAGAPGSAGRPRSTTRSGRLPVQAVPANLMIALDRSGSMAQDRYGNGFVRLPGDDGEYFTPDDIFGSVDRRDLSKPPVAGESTNYFHPGVPYGSPMIDKPGRSAVSEPADGDGYAFAGGVTPPTIPG